MLGHLHTLCCNYAQICVIVALVEEAYHPENCYHNSTHAADVTQALHCLLSERKVSCELILHHLFSSRFMIMLFFVLLDIRVCYTSRTLHCHYSCYLSWPWSSRLVSGVFSGVTMLLTLLCFTVGVNQNFLLNTSSYLASIHGVSNQNNYLAKCQ